MLRPMVAINGLMATFAALTTNHSDEQILDHLTSIQFRLLIKDFNHWDDQIGD